MIVCFNGVEEREGGRAGRVAADVTGRLELVRKEAPGRSIHPLRRFPAECDVRVGKQAALKILSLLWI